MTAPFQCPACSTPFETGAAECRVCGIVPASEWKESSAVGDYARHLATGLLLAVVFGAAAYVLTFRSRPVTSVPFRLEIAGVAAAIGLIYGTWKGPNWWRSIF